MIKQVYEVDPLFCPNCGVEMKIISFIERRQSEVIEKILRHCGLWDKMPVRAPPAGAVAVGMRSRLFEIARVLVGLDTLPASS